MKKAISKLLSSVIFSLITIFIGVIPVYSNSTITKYLYYDSGIMDGANIYTWDGGSSTFNGSYSGAVPNDADGGGVPADPATCFRVSCGASYAGWGIFVSSNMSVYAGGSVKYWVNSPITNAKVEFKYLFSGNETTVTTLLSTYGYSASDVNKWKEITIPVNDLVASGLILTAITSPFCVTAVSVGTLYIDNVRWVRSSGAVKTINITPSAVSMGPGARRTFTTTCYNAGSLLVVPVPAPVWSVTNTSIEQVSSSQSINNVFTVAGNATNGQLVTIKAIADGVTAYANVTVSTQAFSLIYSAYNDNGLVYGSNIKIWEYDSIYQFKESTRTSDLIPTENYVPEGTEFMCDYVNSTWGGWGVFYSTSILSGIRDLSGYSQGYLDFWVKTTNNLKIEMQDIVPKTKAVHLSDYTGSYAWDGTPYWQEIRIPLSDFFGGTAGIDATKVYAPFMATAENVTNPVNFYIDNVCLVSQTVGTGPSKVQISGNQVYVNNTAFTVRGFCSDFSPAGQDFSYDWSTSTQNYRTDISLLSAMNCNTVRLYKAPSNMSAVTEFYNRGIYFIYTYGITPADVANNPNGIKTGFINMVRQFMAQPNTLFFCLGNEVNKSLSGSQLTAWYQLLDQCAKAAHDEESAAGIVPHPVTTANSELGQIGNVTYSANDASLPNLDFWSIQAYSGPSFNTLFTDYKTKSSKPLLMSEFGCDAWDAINNVENQQQQSNYLSSLWTEISANLKVNKSDGQCLGGSVFQWRDEWWKSTYGTKSTHDKQGDWRSTYYYDANLSDANQKNMNEEWWGMCAISSSSLSARSVRQVYYTMRNKWGAPSIMTAKINGSTSMTWTGTLTAGLNLWKVAQYPINVDANSTYSQFLIQLYTDNKNPVASPRYTGPTSTTSGKGFNLVGVSSTSMGLAMAWKVTDTLTSVTAPVWLKNRGDGTEGFTDYQWRWMKDKAQTKANGSTDFASMDPYIRVWDQNGIYWSDHIQGGGTPCPTIAATPNYIYTAARMSDSKQQQYKTNQLILEYIFP